MVEFIGKILQLEKTTWPSTGISMGLQIGDPKHTVNIFGLAQKEFGALCDYALFVYNNFLKKLGNFVHIHLFRG